MKKLLLLPALVAGVLTFTGVSTAQAAGPDPITVSVAGSGQVGWVGGVPGTKQFSTDVPEKFIGQSCGVVAAAKNQFSVHSNNNVSVSSGSDGITLADVEGTSNNIEGEVGEIVLGNTVTATLTVGNDDWSNPPLDANGDKDFSGNGIKQFEFPYGSPPVGLFSMTLTLTFDCDEQEEEPSATAAGACQDDGTFAVTVTNTGDVDIDTVTVGDTSFPLAAGATSPPIPITEDVIVTFSQGIDPIPVTFEDCDPVQVDSTFEASGECLEDGGFEVTVKNTGTVDLDVVTIESVVGSFPLAAGETQMRMATDEDGDDSVSVSADDAVKLVPFEDCSTPGVPAIQVAAFAPVCQADIPFIEWNIVAVNTDATTADLRFFDVDGVQVLELFDQPFKGRIVYPGASVEPPDWPGWVINEDGFWVIDETDEQLREGLRIEVEVNPTATAAVEYPPETSECSGPDGPFPPGFVPPTQTPPQSLPTTGGETTLMALFAALFLSAGGSLLLLSRRTTS